MCYRVLHTSGCESSPKVLHGLWFLARAWNLTPRTPTQMKKSPSVFPAAEPQITPERDAPGIPALLERLRSKDAQAAWEEFLLDYSAVLYQAARASLQDRDEIADCFVYMCEQLAKGGFRRLLQFRPAGPASFTTWLRVVARNLWFDWHRKVHGRLRPFKSVDGLSPLEREVYRCRYERGLSRGSTLGRLQATSPAITEAELENLETRVENVLSPSQRWILAERKQSAPQSPREPIGADGESQSIDAVEQAPSPEARVLDAEQRAALRRSVESLPPDERLVVRLRFEGELSLEEIARLTGLGDAQRAHRRLAAILHKLRAALGQGADRKTAGGVREIRQETR